ncbi:uncharacterized protein LOC120416926 [Culex pipiens pallens]|uniref:uncharacterized protein LOC120416926 n=1 Tax=Culex pipiens pallens TaxID=42434 RepID=UPI0019535413|nr:uncharacterized protein LOC120416926 [Culex pipiens pallens]
MDVHGRLFLISTFVASVVLCVGSKLAEGTFRRSSYAGGYLRYAGDGSVLALHFVYLASSREVWLAKPNESLRLVADSLGSPMASIYAHLQFLVSVLGNHYMSVCASDIVLEYLGILLQQQRMVPLDPVWRAYCALFGNALLTALNCHSVPWTTATFAVYMKSLFMSFWLAKVWFNLPAIQAAITSNQQDFLLLCALTFTLLIILISTKELGCFPHDVVSANQTVLIPLYEHLVGICAPELPIIAACYGAGSMNNFFIGSDPTIQAAQFGHLPFALSLTHPTTHAPIVLLTTRTLITACAVLYLNLYDLTLLSSCWDFLLLTSAILFDVTLLRARHVDLNCQFTQHRPVLPTSLLHASFQLATAGWIFHRISPLRQVTTTLLFTAALTIVAFKALQSEPFVELCCNRARLECADRERPPPAVAKDAAVTSPCLV